MSELRKRGVQVVVDTTEAAEFDIAELGVSDETVEAIGRNLRNLVHSPSDRSFGEVRVRRIGDFDVVFFVARDGLQVVVTVGRVIRPDGSDQIERILKRLGPIAIFRGASGL